MAKEYEKAINLINEIWSYHIYSKEPFIYRNPSEASNQNERQYIIQKNRIGHYLNQNAIVRIYGVLNEFKIIKGKNLDKTIPQWKALEIIRMLRHCFSHEFGNYNKSNPKHLETKNLMLEYLKLKETDFSDGEFHLPKKNVVKKLIHDTKEYIIQCQNPK